MDRQTGRDWTVCLKGLRPINALQINKFYELNCNEVLMHTKK